MFTSLLNYIVCKVLLLANIKYLAMEIIFENSRLKLMELINCPKVYEVEFKYLQFSVANGPLRQSEFKWTLKFM